MSRSFHHTRKSAQRAFADGDFEPIKEYSLKLDLKRWTKKFKKVYGLIKEGRAVSKLRNSVIVSAMKKIKKSLNESLNN